MKHLLIGSIVIVLLAGCQSAEPAAELAKPITPAKTVSVDERVSKKSPPTKFKAPLHSFHDCALFGLINDVEGYIESGFDVNSIGGSFLATPLHYAAQNNRKEVIELLIANGAHVNSRSEQGWTPLHNWAWPCSGNTETAELLLAHGANVNAKDYIGMTPLDWPLISAWSSDERLKEQSERTKKVLLKHGGKSGANDSIIAAASVGNIKALQKHLDAGVDVMTRMFQETTALHQAAFRGRKEIVKLLIDRGADVNAKNEYGQTPIDQTDDKETMNLLIKHGGKWGAGKVIIKKNPFNES